MTLSTKKLITKYEVDTAICYAFATNNYHSFVKFTVDLSRFKYCQIPTILNDLRSVVKAPLDATERSSCTS